MNLHLKWSQLPGHLRKVLLPALVVTILVGVGGFMLSFQALSDWAASTGLFPTEWSWIFPLIVDGGLIVGELLTVAAMIVNAPKLFPATIMGIFGAATVWINLIHAPADWGVRVTAILPPAATISATLGIAWLGKHIATALGMDLSYTPPPPPPYGGLPMPGHLSRPDGYGWQLPPGYAPPGYSGYPPALPHPYAPGANGGTAPGQPAGLAGAAPAAETGADGEAAPPPEGTMDAAVAAGSVVPSPQEANAVQRRALNPVGSSPNGASTPQRRPAGSAGGATAGAKRPSPRPKTGGAKRLNGGPRRQRRPTPEELQARHDRAEAYVLDHLATHEAMPSHSAIANAAGAPDKSWGKRFIREHGTRLQTLAQGTTNVLQIHARQR